MDTACVDVCPVDCIHTTEGEKQLYINPDECIDCAACEPVCPVDAISMQSDVPSEWEPFIEINRKFFETFVKPETADAGADETGKTKQGKQQGIPEEFVQIPEVPDSRLRAPYNILAMLGQPLLGAFSAKFKARLEEMAGSPLIFSSAVSTGINSLINLTLYPLILFFIGVKGQSANLFTSEGNLMIFLGIIIAISEGIYRFKDEFNSTVEQPRYGAAFYGWFPSLIATPLLIGLRSALVGQRKEERTTMPGAVLTDGKIYSDDVRERYRRYGMINRLTEQANHYEVEIEFPRWVPNSVAKQEHELPDRMPDYTYEIQLSSPYVPGESLTPESILTVQTQLDDPRFASVVGRTSSFPNGFTNIMPISGQPEDFQATYRNKVLTIIVSKSGTCESLGLEPTVHYAKLKG
jgi:NAD-dependent dihydropyrimidine dehydrogenase PreA subunit